MFALSVTIDVVPDEIEAFIPLMQKQATDSLREEEGCLTFDVWREGTQVFLYEVYTSEAAFQAHLKMPYFAVFDAAVTPMILDKSIKTYSDRL